MRRSVVFAAMFLTATAGAGLAANASAAPATLGTTCVNPGPLCAPYDTAKSETAAALAEAAFACTSFRDVPCATVDATGQTVYDDVFFPYEVCYHLNGPEQCIGPIE